MFHKHTENYQYHPTVITDNTLDKAQKGPIRGTVVGKERRGAMTPQNFSKSSDFWEF